MRIWDIAPKRLCRQHLLGEHRELHGLWNILIYNKKGYSQHPETKRWVGKTAALKLRHDQLVAEMERRGYKHLTPLGQPSDSELKQNLFINTIQEQGQLLNQKDCECQI